MGRLSLSLLGSFEAVIAGHPVQGFRSQKVRALLAYLAAEPDQPQPRQLLSGLLWPDLPDATARTNLRTALWNLRTLCDHQEPSSPLFLVTTDTVQFNRAAGARVDLQLFLDWTADRELLQPGGMNWPVVARLEEAVSLYRGPFLEGFFVDSAPFEEWILLRQEQTAQRLLRALRYLAAAYEESGDYEVALAHSQRQLEANPWEEEAHQRAMRLLALSGRRGAALAQYETCRRVLREELGVEPVAATQALAATIREGQLETLGARERRGKSRAPLQPPVPASPIFGRTSEIMEIIALLIDRAHLLSIVGPGGIGKTRLALEVAQRLAPSFAGGAAVVDLTPVSEPEGVVPAIARALGLAAGKGIRDLNVELQHTLRERAILLVLDNFEHLLDGAPLLTDMIEAAPNLRIMVTSRERLNLQAEHVIFLQGLPCSEWKTLTDAEQDPAVQLFLHHAQRVRPSFVLRRDQLPSLRAILVQVEGMPLALILAAAWVEVMSLAEIATEISRSPVFLEAPYRDLPPRQRSMRALFESTWLRLDERERRIFAALSVFRAGFTKEAAQEVTLATAWELRRFVNHSMLSCAAGERFAMHELWRKFAAEELARSPEKEEDVRERHAIYYCRFLQERSTAFKDERAEQTGAELATEFENAKAAWNWAADHGRVSLLEDALILGFYCIRQGRRMEGAAMSQRAVEKLARTDSGPGQRMLGFLLAAQVAFTGSGVSPDKLKEALAEAFEHLKAAAVLGEDVRYEEGFTLMMWGQALIDEDCLQARSHLERSLALLGEVDAWYERANVTVALARSYEVQADYGAALAYASKALRSWELVGERHWINATRMQLGVIRTKVGQVEQGVKEIREAMAFFEGAGNRYYSAEAQLTLGNTLVTLGRFDEALPLLSKSHVYLSGIGMADTSRPAWCWAALHRGHFGEVWRQSRVLPAQDDELALAEARFLQGCVALALENLDEAVALLQASVASYRAGSDPARLSRVLAVSGSALLLSGLVAAAQREIVEALRLVGQLRLAPAAAVALPAVALLLVETGTSGRAIEIYEVARRDPSIANSIWFEEVFGRRMADVAALLPEETVKAARARARLLALWELVNSLLNTQEIYPWSVASRQ